MADYVRSVHFDKLNRTVCACNGKIGILMSFPDGPVTDAFFPPLITAHLAKHKQGDPAIANALALFTLTKRLNVIVGPDPAYNTDPGYPRLGMTLAPGPQYGIVPWDGGLEFPPDRMATLAEFIDKYAAGRSPWMTFDNKTAPRVKPALMHIVVPLDPATTANAVVFMLPDPEPKTVTGEGQQTNTSPIFSRPMKRNTALSILPAKSFATEILRRMYLSDTYPTVLRFPQPFLTEMAA
jgi:hypothetical protein